MASTIITKNGTSGAPSSLVAGELAINTENGSLYYGSTGGTAVSSSFTFSNITSSGTISASGMIQTAGAISSSTGITASDAFFSGNITASNLSLASTIQHAGDTNNKISFGEDIQDYKTGGSSRLDISDSGVRLGGANSRVTTILDEDNMASDSATSLATQQSIKAYVDASGGSVSGNTFATDLKIGRDADNLIDFTTDNQVTFRVSAGNGVVMKASGEISASGMIQTAGAISSSTGITASDAFFSGDVTASNLSLASTIHHTGDTDTKMVFASNRVDFVAGGNTAITMGSDGITALNAGGNLDIGSVELKAQTFESDATTGTAPLTVASTTVVSNLNADKLDGADLVDEDDMSSNSATKVPTQQSVKAYADTKAPIASPTFTGTPAAPTAAAGTNTTQIATTAHVKASIDAKFSYQYIHFIGNQDITTNWATPAINGSNAHNWNTDTGESGTTVGTTTITLARSRQTTGFTIPFTGELVGFTGMIRNNVNNAQGALGLFHAPFSDFGGRTGTTAFTLQAYALGVTTGGAGTSFQGNCKAIDTSRSHSLSQGDMIIPAAIQGSDKIFYNLTLIIKTPLT